MMQATTDKKKARGLEKQGAGARSSPEGAAAPLKPAEAGARIASVGRNDACPCGSGRKYKKCHLAEDQQAASPPPAPPTVDDLIMEGWRLLEQRRPGAAEKAFRAALDADAKSHAARVGVGMARLAAGNADGARAELEIVVNESAALADKLKRDQVKDAFSDEKAQPYIRAAHALGCLAYDQKRYQDAADVFERVHAVDDGAVGVEARLIGGKALLKAEKAKAAVTLLEPTVKSEHGGMRAQATLALARFAAGDKAAARPLLEQTLTANPYLPRAILSANRRYVENVLGAAAGTLEEAVVYAQTFGDVWDDAAKAFLKEVAAA
jgi:tetratricopeptide (TPR) repeat protein